MIVISYPEPNSNDSVFLDETSDSDIYNYSGRISRSKTLDGSSTIVHNGFDHSDRNPKIKAKIDRDQETILRDMVENQTILNFSTHEGFFEGVVKSMVTNNGSLVLQVYYKEKKSQ